MYKRQPLWGDKLGQWLAEEWNAVVVSSFQQMTPYEKIDTSTEESMLFGLARRAIAEVPTIRQGRGWVDVVVEDLRNEIQNNSIDAVLFSGHQGKIREYTGYCSLGIPIISRHRPGSMCPTVC